MVLVAGRRIGKTWDDVRMIDQVIRKMRFNLTGKSEREFELTFASTLTAHSEKLSGKIYSQTDKDTIVESVYLFGKKHRPDMTINHDGIAVELKFLSSSLDGLKQALGQSLIYRAKYRFVVNIFVIAETHKETYLKGANDEEKDLAQILKYLAQEMNVFSYIVPAFNPGSNIKALLEWNDL